MDAWPAAASTNPPIQNPSSKSKKLPDQMPHLYRSPSEPQHWLVWSDDLGWSRFPAKTNGWRDRRPAGIVFPQKLQRVPLQLAFNTGLLESISACSLSRAA
jgi:hypothetical protein